MSRGMAWWSHSVVFVAHRPVQQQWIEIIIIGTITFSYYQVSSSKAYPNLYKLCSLKLPVLWFGRVSVCVLCDIVTLSFCSVYVCVCVLLYYYIFKGCNN